MRILIVTARPPWPPRRGDQARVAGVVAELANRHEIMVAALRPPGFGPCEWPSGVRGFTVRLGLPAAAAAAMGHPALPFQVAVHLHRAFMASVAQAVSDFRPHVALVVLSRMGGVLDQLRGVPVVLDLIDALELNLTNRAARQRWLAPLLRIEARRIGAWDRSLVQRTARTLVVSERDRAAVTAGLQTSAERVEIVPFGVPVLPEPPQPRGGSVVLLSGNLGYFPTVDGARWFAAEVWPLVRRRHAEAEWWLAGARPARRVRALASLPGVSLLPSPPRLADIRARTTVAVAPMHSGSGTPIKVLEAMAEGVPVVATPAAAAGLDGIPGRAIRVAATGEEFAREICTLLEDHPRGHDQACEAWRWVREHHSLVEVARRFEAILEEVSREPS